MPATDWTKETNWLWSRTVDGVRWTADTSNGGRTFYVWKDGASVKRAGGSVAAFKSIESAAARADLIISGRYKALEPQEV